MKVGSVTKLGPTRFWARGPRPERVSLGVWPTYEEADDVREAAAQDLARADRLSGSTTTVRAYGSRHLDELEIAGDVAIASRRSRWKHVERAPFIDMPIGSVQRPVVVAWIKTLQRTKVRKGKRGKLRIISPTMVNAVVGGLGLVFEAALNEGLVQTNPVRGIRKQKTKAVRHERDEDMAEVWTYLDSNEQHRLLTCERVPECDRLIIAFAIGTGVRQGEQWNLELPDLHVDGPHPHVVVRWGAKGRKPKNGKIRTVPLFGIALIAARRWLEVLPTYARSNPHRLVFPRPSGARRAPSTHLHRGAHKRIDGFRDALAAAGIVRPVRWHDLRHTCASSLVGGWWGLAWTLDQVRDVLGHTSIRITERYAHLAPAVMADLAARTPGLRPGDGLRVLPSVSRSDLALAPGSGWSIPLQGIPGPSAANHPPITRDQAIAGLRALARGDLAGARLAAASGWDEAALCRLFDAALDLAADEAGDVEGKAWAR